MTDDEPDDDDVRATAAILNGMGDVIDAQLSRLAGKRIAYVLIVSDGTRCTGVSNLEDQHAHHLLRQAAENAHVKDGRDA